MSSVVRVSSGPGLVADEQYSVIVKYDERLFILEEGDDRDHQSGLSAPDKTFCRTKKRSRLPQ
jgi:hypothetical protein